MTTIAPAAEPPAPRRALYACDAALVAGVRAGDLAAWDAFFVRFEPVLVRDARRIGVPDAVRDDLVCETIGAALEQLSESDGVVPAALGGYLRCALRNRAHNHARGERRREQRAAAAAEPVGDCAAVVTSTVSAYTLALVRGPAAGGAGAPNASDRTPPPHPAGDAETGYGHDSVHDPIRTLAHVLAAALRPGEQELLERQQAGATHAELAAWLGIRPAATAKRLARLRQRLHAVAEAYAAALPATGRREVCRFLGRARAAHGSPHRLPHNAPVEQTPAASSPTRGVATPRSAPAGPRTGARRASQSSTP